MLPSERDRVSKKLSFQVLFLDLEQVEGGEDPGEVPVVDDEEVPHLPGLEVGG